MGALESTHLKDVQKSITKFTSDISRPSVTPKVVNVTKSETEPESLSALANSLLNFTSDLCNVFEHDDALKENYICSTLSAHIVLSLAACGADKNTALEMKNVLHLAGDELLGNYRNLVENLNPKKNIEPQSNDINSPRYTRNVEKHESIVTLANKIYVSKDIKVKEDFENVLSMYFRSRSETLDFSKSSESAGIINKWCSESTHGKITNILAEDELNPDTALVLTNAVYFKGNWDHEFDTATPKTFHVNMNKKIEVPTMFKEGDLQYKNLPELNAQAVRLHFMGKNYMEVIVPNEIDGLKNVQKNLNTISEIEFKWRDVRLWLPKFQIESKIEFNKHLENLGMIDAFDAVSADFNKMCDRHVHIEKVVQKAFIKVDEIGCEAAAFTLAGLVDRCGRLGEPEYIIVRADRPFLFRIIDAESKVPLFIGSVVNPQ